MNILAVEVKNIMAFNAVNSNLHLVKGHNMVPFPMLHLGVVWLQTPVVRQVMEELDLVVSKL